MLFPSAALSISDQVEKFGAYAGFAAVVGLAVLALLYFASARELKRLREWADRAPERVADLEARFGELARQRAVVPQPIGKPAGAGKQAAVPATAAAAAAASKPAAKPPAVAGNGAADPAVPVVSQEGAAATPEQPGDDTVAFDAVAENPGDLTEIKKPAAPEESVPPPPAPPAVDETMVSPGAARELRQNKPSARPRTPPPVRPSTARLMESARASNAQRVTGAGGIAPAPPAEGHRRRNTALFAAVAVGALLLVVLVTGVLGGGDESGPKTNTVVQPTSSTETDSGSGSTIDRAATEVAVLNGTTFTGLAKGVGDTLKAGGFNVVDARNGLDQTKAATIVEYTEGNRAAALEVARTIPGVGSDAVIKATQASIALEPNAKVIVTVGADQTPTTE